MDTDKKEEDYSLTSFDYVIVEKEKLLATLRKNRDEHDEIYKAACQGYWIKCGEVLEEKKEAFDLAIREVKDDFKTKIKQIGDSITNEEKTGIKNLYIGLAFNATWPLIHPSNHLEDYDRAISMLEFSVADKVRLTAQHFNAYVRNTWDWNGDFINSNLGYVTAVTGCIVNTIAGYSGMAVASNNSAYKFALANNKR